MHVFVSLYTWGAYKGLPCCWLHVQVAALAPDELVGDNQYFCDYCAAKSDADRRMHLRSLPPYLCLALQRFTYDQQVRRRHMLCLRSTWPGCADCNDVDTRCVMQPAAGKLCGLLHVALHTQHFV